MTNRIKINAIETLSHDWAKLTKTSYEYQRLDGTWQTHHREIFDHGNAAVVLLHDPVRDCVVLVRQFRLPVHNEGKDGWILEIVGGLLDGDAPEACVRKEAVEEAGITIQSLDFAFEAFASPGSLSEMLYCYIGTYSGPITVHHAGLEEEGEDIEVIELPLAEAYGMIASGQIIDAKTIMLLQHLVLSKHQFVG